MNINPAGSSVTSRAGDAHADTVPARAAACTQEQSQSRLCSGRLVHTSESRAECPGLRSLPRLLGKGVEASQLRAAALRGAQLSDRACWQFLFHGPTPSWPPRAPP